MRVLTHERFSQDDDSDGRQIAYSGFRSLIGENNLTLQASR